MIFNRPVPLLRSVSLPALTWLIAFSSAAEPFGLEGYPGLPPGPFVIRTGPGEISASNAALHVSWKLQPQGLTLASVEDAATRRTLPATGPVFEIVFADGTRHAASALRPTGEPRTSTLPADPKAIWLASQTSARRVELPLRSPDGKLEVLWRALCTDGANYLRQEIEIRALADGCIVKEIVWLDQAVPDARIVGQVDGSPIVAGPFFLGCEDPHARNEVNPGADTAPAGTPRISCRLRRNTPLSKGDTLSSSFVLGVTPPGQLRRAFLYYLERERAHPYRPFLHYNSWYDIAWTPFALNETNCLDAIRTLGEQFIRAQGVTVDAMVFDDGWDDPKTLWQFHGGFPNGFAPLADLCRHYHTRLGVWLSPFGGYGEPRNKRLKFGQAQRYETNAAGFSLAGPRYYEAFKDACVRMIRQYGVNHFKFDGIAAGMYAGGGAEYVRDTEAMRQLMLELRREEPDLYINLTTGSWPSPFWLRFADSVWRQGGDMGFAGKGPKQQQWLTYRDQEVFRNIVRKGPLYPLNALMTQGVAYSRQGDAGLREYNSAGFKDDVRAFFGAGTSLQELYIQPGRLTPQDWAVLAEAAKWSRAHADVLVDTHWIGGDPGKLEVYGYASWSPRHGILMLRNPDDQPHEFLLDIKAAFELPPGASTRYQFRSPWAEDAQRPEINVEAGQPVQITLKPFEVAVFEATPEP
jgi:hypothetical protein